MGSDVSVRQALGLAVPLGSEWPLKGSFLLQHLLPSASIQDAQQWLHRNRFSQFCRLFASFSGECLRIESHGKHFARLSRICPWPAGAVLGMRTPAVLTLATDMK
jgi:hypothetical protein